MEMDPKAAQAQPVRVQLHSRGSATAIKDRDFAEESITVAKDSGKRIYKVTRTDGYKQPAREIETSVNL